MNTRLHHYKACGLDYIYLQNGFQIHETPYGKGVSIIAADKLHQAIAREIVTAPRPIGGQEVRFLRSLLDLSQTQLASILGTTRITVTRWESRPNDPLPGLADTAIRLVYVESQDKDSLVKRVIEFLRERDDTKYVKKDRKTKFSMTMRGNSWDTAKAA